MTDFNRIKKELEWLKDNPQFDERPATISEFIGPEYLNIAERVRPALLVELENIIGKEIYGDRLTRYPRAMVTGGVGIGKTTVASIVLPYLAHWVLCLKDPQGYFKLLPGSRIAFMQMSTSGPQAKEVVFGDIKARIEYSPWFQDKYPYDRNFKNQIRFPKDIWILPGDSAETTFEGYNILGGILDEADSHKISKNKDYAEIGYTTISARISSRFQDRGFLLVIGQMKRANGFAARKYAEYQKDPDAYAVRMAIWESIGWENFLDDDGNRKSFWYDTERHEIVPTGIGSMVNLDNLIEIPKVYQKDFENNPQKALRDLAGIPPATGSPFIPLTYKIIAARDRYIEKYQVETPVDEDGQLADWFYAPDSLKRVIHLDMAFSGQGDALGLAMGHVPEVVEIDGEMKPYIVFDLLLRIHAPAGREIFLGDIRRIIYDLQRERNFKIVKVTLDGFQSTDTRQQLEKKRIETEIVSVDKQLLPYHDLREAIYEDRVSFPKYMVRFRRDDTKLTEVAYKELSELMDNGAKVDHPETGSKDVADAMAGVVYTLMGERQFHRKVVRLDLARRERQAATGTAGNYPTLRPGLMRSVDPSAPIPPVGAESLWNPKGRN